MERQELELAARRVAYLRGLHLVPLAGFLLWSHLRPHDGVEVTGWVDAIVFGVLLALAFGIKAYYDRTYGRVGVSNGRFLAARLLLLVGFLGGSWLDLRRLGNTSAELDRVAQDGEYLHHINLMVLLASISVLLWYRICVELRREHLILWGALIVIALIPIWHRGDNASSDVLPGLMTFAIAATGIADHLALRRSFRSPDRVPVDG